MRIETGPTRIRVIEIETGGDGPTTCARSGGRTSVGAPTVFGVWTTSVALLVNPGLTGKIIAGLSGSIGSGYKFDPHTRGKRVVIDKEAKIVRRIFENYATGASPRTLAATLNAEDVPGPQGRVWIDTTIRGQVDRGTGLLNNELYIGRIVWNRTSYVRDPKTGKRVARLNPKDEWEISSDENLRIVDDAPWERVKAQQGAVRTVMARDAHGVPLNRAHRAQHLLSGLERKPT